jgi:FdrA protein
MTARDISKLAAAGQVPRGPVGIVSTSRAAIQEVICLLARDDVGVSHVFGPSRQVKKEEEEGLVLLAGLRALQVDPATSVIILASRSTSPSVVTPVLAGVTRSDKPVIACLLGGEPRQVWQSGAIPAARLDEAAMRAAAWVRGWDQALVSSGLEDQDEQLAAMAAKLRSQLGPARSQVRALLTDEILCDEAQVMFSDLAKRLDSPGLGSALTAHVQLNPALWRRDLRHALADPHIAVILLHLALGDAQFVDPIGALTAVVGDHRHSKPPAGDGAQDEPWIIAQVCSPGCNPKEMASQRARLWNADVILATSNAAAARLAGLIVRK